MGIDDVFRALSDPTRREILRLLRNRDMTAGEIAEQFPIAFASVSHHLGVPVDWLWPEIEGDEKRVPSDLVRLYPHRLDAPRQLSTTFWIAATSSSVSGRSR